MSRAKIGKRCHVVITPQQEKRLEALVRRTGLGQGEHIRRAIDAYFRLLESAESRAKNTPV